MANPPDWYPRHVIAWRTDEAVQSMTLEQEGAYSKLLDSQWIEGSIPSDCRKLAGILKVDAESFADIWHFVGEKFEPLADNPGRLVNKKLAAEREKSIALIDAKTELGRKGGVAKASNRLAGARQVLGQQASSSLAGALHINSNKYSLSQDLSSSLSLKATEDLNGCDPAERPHSARCDLRQLEVDWRKHAKGISSSPLGTVADLCERAALDESPPADPNEYARRALAAFEEYRSGIEREERRPAWAPHKFAEHFGRIQRIVAGIEKAMPSHGGSTTTENQRRMKELMG